MWWQLRPVDHFMKRNEAQTTWANLKTRFNVIIPLKAVLRKKKKIIYGSIIHGFTSLNSTVIQGHSQEHYPASWLQVNNHHLASELKGLVRAAQRKAIFRIVNTLGGKKISLSSFNQPKFLSHWTSSPIAERSQKDFDRFISERSALSCVRKLKSDLLCLWKLSGFIIIIFLPKNKSCLC